MRTNEIQTAERLNRGLVSAIERRVFISLARRLPEAVKPDHLTALGFGSLLAVRALFTVGLWLAILFPALNWFGDSLDGTLARVRGGAAVALRAERVS
jgi:archaetidylinositol phosphate synthase